MEREHGGVQGVAKFVRRVAQAFSLVGGSRLCRHTSMFGDSLRDRGVETSVEGMEFFHRDEGSLLDRKRRDRLADVAIVMDDLGHRKAESDQVASVARGSRTNSV